jgi:hypothetical protein
MFFGAAVCLGVVHTSGIPFCQDVVLRVLGV